MRADVHYVEALSSGARPDRARDAARATAADDTLRHGAHDRRLLDQLTDDVAAIESAAAMLTAERSPLARRVGLDLIKAQSARASWLLRASALIASVEADSHARRRPLGDILVDIRNRAAVECRLVGVGLEVEVPIDVAAVALPDATLVAGLTGAVMAQLGLIEGIENVPIRLRAALAPGETPAITIEVTQDSVQMPSGSQARFFDAAWVSRPGGWLAAIGAATARIAAERLGGTVAVVTTERRGCTIRYTLP